MRGGRPYFCSCARSISSATFCGSRPSCLVGDGVGVDADGVDVGQQHALAHEAEPVAVDGVEAAEGTFLPRFVAQ